MGDGPKAEWHDVFTAQEAPQSNGGPKNPLAVQVQKLALPRARYSLRIGSSGARGFRGFLPIEDTDDESNLHGRLLPLLSQAMEYVRAERRDEQDRHEKSRGQRVRDFRDPGRP